MNIDENKIKIGNSSNQDKKTLKVPDINYNKGSSNERDFKMYCKICGKVIPKNGLGPVYTKRVTCGDDKCKKEYDNYLSRKRRENLIKKGFIKIEKEYRKCKYCGEEFLWNSSHSEQIYCSKECCKKMIKKRYIENDSHYLKIRFEIFKRDKFTCQYCGRNVKEDKIKIELEHIHPKAKGGSNNPNNLITSCYECNHGKADILLEERRYLKIKEKK